MKEIGDMVFGTNQLLKEAKRNYYKMHLKVYINHTILQKNIDMLVHGKKCIMKIQDNLKIFLQKRMLGKSMKFDKDLNKTIYIK